VAIPDWLSCCLVAAVITGVAALRPRCREIASGSMVPTVPAAKPRALLVSCAEMLPVLEFGYRCSRVAVDNMLKDLCKDLCWRVLVLVLECIRIVIV
jgi:hypothetical protein